MAQVISECERHDETARADALFRQHRHAIFCRTDILFARLLVFQWLAAILVVLLVSPRTWVGSSSQVHMHVWASLVLGAVIAVLPVALAVTRPGEVLTRHVIAVAQMLMGSLLIHLSGGRIEVHFHIFGSLAFLAFYRDWRVLITASSVVVLDHILRGTFWPWSIFGVLSASPWRWVEHASWVVFEDLFLIGSCRLGVREMREIAEQQAQLEATGHQIERTVLERTAELRQSEARHTAILETAHDGIVSFDDHGLIIGFNPAAEVIFGRHRAEAMGMSTADLFSPSALSDGPRVERIRFLGTGDDLDRRIEATALRADGTEFPIEMAVTITRHQEGAANFTAFVRDITERKVAEKAQARFVAILEATTDFVGMADRSGRILYVNVAGRRMVGMSESELAHTNMSDFFPDEAKEIVAKEGLPTAYREGAWSGELAMLRRDGSEIPVSMVALAHKDSHGEVEFVSTVCRDITESKRSQAGLLEAKRAAESATRAKSEFLANMSHEIRTPMNGIIGMTELALDTQLSPQQREYLGLVQASADDLLAVINDILDFSKIEAGKLDLDFAPFSLRVTVEDTLRALAFRAHAKGLELACRIAPDVPETLVGDPGRLRQILVNLVGNAIKFTDRGEIVVTVEAQPPAGDSIGLNFTVADTGIGIPEQKRRAIFEPFEQADGSTTRKYGGTGLGLTISAKLIALMHGQISVDGEVGQGSTFHFTARFAVGSERPPRSVSREPTRIASLRVLIVDDNQTNRRILEEILLSWGALPTAVDGGPAALAALRKAAASGAPFGLAVLDGMMPEMDGFTLAGLIRSEPMLATIVLVMLTSWGPSGDADRLRELGIGATLTKPVRQTELFGTLMRVLGPSVAPCVEGGGSALPGAAIRQGEGRPARSLCILLAEDHAVNQKLAVRMLEELGHTTTVVGDGCKAVAAWEAGQFDLILMDVQMPEMDGFEAVAAVRERERRRGGHVPVIALTAHAMKGDRERCLAAGMDGYLAKPLKRQDLSDALAPLVIAAPKPAEMKARPGGTTGPQFQFEPLYSRCGEDAEFVHELVASFLDAAPQSMAGIEAALVADDFPRLAAEAHGLRGICLTIGADALASSCGELEDASRRADRSGVRAALAPARGEWADLQSLLLFHCQEGL